MADIGRHAVTGAFGYSGRYIAGHLLVGGCGVVTLTNSGGRSDRGPYFLYTYNAQYECILCFLLGFVVAC